MSNPIQQQIDKIAKKWNDSKENEYLKLIRFFRGKQDKELIDCFFLYMLGVDTPISDIAFVFETSFKNPAQFSMDLVKELETIIDEWNHSKKEGIEHFEINWKPDYIIKHPRNSAGLFLDNFKKLTDELGLKSNVFAVAVFSHLDIRKNLKALNWLDDALEIIGKEQIRLVIEEDQNQIETKGLKEKWKGKIGTIWCEFNLDNAMEQIAGMGNPNDPSTQFRYNFFKLFKAVEKRLTDQVNYYADKCIKIATKNLSKDPYWASQIVTVYTFLSSHHIASRNTDKAIFFSTKALQTSLQIKEELNKEMSYRLIGQAALFRGSLFLSENKYEKALEDYTLATTHYIDCEDYTMSIEAYRMKGVVFHKIRDYQNEFLSLMQGFKLYNKTNIKILEASSFTILTKQLLKIDNKETPYHEIDQVMTKLHGTNWGKVI